MDKVQREVTAMRKKLYEEELVDEQFVSVEKLGEDMGNPKLVQHAWTLFFTQAPEYIASIENISQKDPVDFVEMERLFQKLRGSSATIGAKKVAEYVSTARKFCQEQNIKMILPALEEVKTQIQILGSYLEDYFILMVQVRQARPAQQPEESCDSN